MPVAALGCALPGSLKLAVQAAMEAERQSVIDGRFGGTNPDTKARAGLM